MPRTFLDVASGWPLRPVAAQALQDALPITTGDPTRAHREGRATADLLERATATLAHRLGADERDVVWTSGGTEAASLAAVGGLRAVVARDRRRSRVVVCAVEHSAVLRSAEQAARDVGGEVVPVGVDGAGEVDLEALVAAVDERTALVHLQHANHEVGTLQPTHEAARACRAAGALLHVDACQGVGQLGVTLDQLGADLLSCSAAKFGGPRGVGALLLGPRARLAPQLLGDDRQRGRRAGALDVAAVAAAAVALEEAVATMQADRSARELSRRRLRAGLAALPDVAVHGRLAEAHPGIVAASALYVAGDALVAALDERGWAVASGSSCASAAGVPSHVLVAMGALTHGHLRVSFGASFGEDAVDAFVADVADVVAELRRSTGRGRL